MSWIPVNRELPADNATVLVCCPDEDEPVWLGHCEGGQWWSVEAVPIRVTHWQPKPEPATTNRKRS